MSENTNENLLKQKQTIDVGNDWVIPLMEQGIIVDLKIKKWSGKGKLDADDLGLKNLDASTLACQKKYIHLGQERLFPPEALNQINSIVAQGKKNLRDHSFDTLWGSFVPIDSFLEWEQNNEELKKEFKEAVRKLGEDYHKILVQVSQDYGKMAQDVWFRLNPNADKPPQIFIDDYVAKQIEKIPDVVDLLMLFDYNEKYYSVTLPGLVEKQVTMVEEERHNQEFMTEKTRMRAEAEKRVNEIFIEQREEMIDSFLKDTVYSIRKHICKICDEVLLSLNKNDNSMKKSHRQKVLSMLEKVESLNFCHDEKIEDMLADLKKDILKPQSEVFEENIIIKLTNISEKVKKTINPDFNENIEFIDF